MLYDFLARQQAPFSEPLKIRFGYSNKPHCYHLNNSTTCCCINPCRKRPLTRFYHLIITVTANRPFYSGPPEKEYASTADPRSQTPLPSIVAIAYPPQKVQALPISASRWQICVLVPLLCLSHSATIKWLKGKRSALFRWRWLVITLRGMINFQQQGLHDFKSGGIFDGGISSASMNSLNLSARTHESSQQKTYLDNLIKGTTDGEFDQ
ncbi:hypothetical protein, partial [Chitinophaga pinensis]